MEKTISYLARNYNDFKSEFQKYTRKYYPSMMNDFQDASVGEWFIDLISALGDDLSYHTDRTFQETDSNSAQQKGSLLDIARTNGLKIPGRKSAMVEIEISCELPLKGDPKLQLADEAYAPIVKQGTVISTGLITFQIMHDVNFAEQFNEDGISDRQIIPKRNANGLIEKYTYKKLALALAGESKIYRQTLTSNDITPFMEVLLQDTNIELIDVEYVKEKDWYLRVFIDKDGGIEIEDCQSLSEQLEEKLDELDPISDSYYLEVSSPGLDRALKKDKDFQRHLGDKIEITTYAPINGSKIIVGTLKQYSAENLTIEVEENIISIEREKIAKVKLYLDF